jgi:hypothetical protein
MPGLLRVLAYVLFGAAALALLVLIVGEGALPALTGFTAIFSALTLGGVLLALAQLAEDVRAIRQHFTPVPTHAAPQWHADYESHAAAEAARREALQQQSA